MEETGDSYVWRITWVWLWIHTWSQHDGKVGKGTLLYCWVGVTLYNPPNGSVRHILLAPFCRWGTGGSWRLSNLPKVTQQVNTEPKSWTAPNFFFFWTPFFDEIFLLLLQLSWTVIKSALQQTQLYQDFSLSPNLKCIWCVRKSDLNKSSREGRKNGLVEVSGGFSDLLWPQHANVVTPQSMTKHILNLLASPRSVLQPRCFFRMQTGPHHSSA